MSGVLTNRMRVNFLSGRASADIAVGSPIASADFNVIPVVAAPEYMVLVLDPDQDFGVPEIVHVTAHLAGDTQMTVVRGQEGTTERTHPASTAWRNTGTAGEYDDIERSGLPIGSGALWFTATPPINWLIADGSAIPAQYTALIALIGANLPDMRGRFPAGVSGSSPALSAKGGLWSHTHNGKAHTHDTPDHGATNTGSTGSSHTHVVPDITNGGSHGHTVATTASGGSHDHTNSGVAQTGGSGGRLIPDTGSSHVHPVGTSGSSHTHSIPDAATNTHDHTVSNANTTGSGHTHNMPAYTHGQTGDGSTHGSTDPTSASNPPYFGLHFIIKAA